MQRIIGLSSIGFQTGKTTAANYLLQKKSNGNLYEMSDYIRKELEILIPTFKILDPFVQRGFLQTWGEYKRKRISDDYWVDMIFKNEKVLDKFSSIISGIRSQTEARYIIKNNGIVILLTDNKIENIDKISEIEKQLFEVKDDKKYVTYCIHNDGTINDLYKKLDMLIVNNIIGEKNV